MGESWRKGSGYDRVVCVARSDVESIESSCEEGVGSIG